VIGRRKTTTGSTAFLALALASLQLTGCATAPEETQSERLDENTGTTLTLMPKPVELIAEQTHGAKSDPFAYVAPFETNRMGSHELFLWVSAPQPGAPLSVPQVYCGNDRLPLEKIEGAPKEMGLSSPPYKVPAPWSAEWYFKISGEVLDCLASASQIRVTTQPADAPEPDSYVGNKEAITGVSVFLAHVRT
jgi:hypothetical protein